MIRTLIYWDSATFLAYFKEEEGRSDLCRNTLERAERGQVGIITSALTIAECLWLRGEPLPIPKNRSEIVRRFFRRSFIRVRNVTRQTAELAQDVVWDYGIRPKDAIHVATAIENKVGIVETFDEPFIDKSGLIGTFPLVIRRPLPVDQMKLL